MYVAPDLFANARGGQIGGSPFSNFRGTIGYGYTTPDLQSIAANTLRSKLAHAALIQAQNQQAAQDNHLLQSASPTTLGNLFSAPTNPDEARIQQVVQQDYNAKRAGEQLIPTWKMLQDYQHGLLTNQHLASQIQDETQQRQYRPLTFGLDQSKFGLTKDEFANTKDYQGKILANDAARVAADQAQRAAQLKFEQQNANRSDQRILDSQFQNAQKAVQEGQLSAQDVIDSMPGLTPGQQAVLRGHEASVQQQAVQAQARANTFNQSLNQKIEAAGIPAAVPSLMNWWSKAPAIPATEADINQARDSIRQQIEKDALARKQVFFDPETGTIKPLIKAPTSSSANIFSGYQDPVPAYLRNQVTGMRPDTQSGAMPDQSMQQPYIPYGPPSGYQYGGADYSGATGSVDPSQDYGGASQSGKFEGADGYLYDFVNGQMQRTNMRRTR